MIKDSVDTEIAPAVTLQYLKSMRSLSTVIRQISKMLLILTDKRATVAEKAIQEELVFLAELESSFLCSLIGALKEKSYWLAEEDCLVLVQLNIRLNKQLQGFIKAAQYNLNYLEQYFEHDFWIELINNKFVDQLNQIKDRVGIKRY